MTSVDQQQGVTLRPEEANRLRSILMPYRAEKLQELYKDRTNVRFVHYTSAEAALQIIKNKRIWMRNTTCMTDYSEVEHGYKILLNFFSDNNNKTKFIEALEACCSGVAMEALTLFDTLWYDIRFNTYIVAVSEHFDEEDSHGRLSMWRAFGGNIARVALVINVPMTSNSIQVLNIEFSPVSYLKEKEIYEELHRVINNVRTNSDFLRSVNRQILVHIITHMLIVTVVCLKHEGFHEEREWRVIYAPKRLPSEHMEYSTEVIGGIPQPVCKIPLESTRTPLLGDLDFFRLFDRLIIGPSQYSWPMRESFVAALKKSGVADAEERVFVSGIPIRT